MKLNNIYKLAIFSSLLTASTVSCVKKPLKEIQTTYLPEKAMIKLDSISKESQKVLQDTSYHFYGYDTLELNINELKTEPEKIVKKLDKKAKQNTPRSVVRTYTVMEPMFFNNKMKLYPKIKHDYEPNFIKQKAIIKDIKLFTKDSTDFYVPVEYYGIPNQKVLNKNK